MKYPDAFEGEWVTPRLRSFFLRCCDCALVHRVNFRLKDGKIQWQMFRDNRKTAAIRRHKKRGR